MAETIQTRHPEGKQGVNIDAAKYGAVKEAIVSTLSQRGEMTFGELTRAVGERLEGSFDGSVAWYVTTVKLDLEARGVVERVSRGSPQRIRLVEGTA